MSKQHLVRGAWAVAAIMATGVAWAALPQQTSNDPASGQAPGTTQRSADWNQNRGRAMNGRVDVDHFLTKVIRQANRDEIATAQLAEKRASNPDVKKFAMQMVDDHTRFMNRLQQFEAGQHKAMPGARNAALIRERRTSSRRRQRLSLRQRPIRPTTTMRRDCSSQIRPVRLTSPPRQHRALPDR